MRNTIYLFFFLFFFIKGFGQDNTEKYMNLLVSTGQQKNIDAKTKSLENKIDKLCDSAVYFLKTMKEDSTLKLGLIKLFQSEKNTYQERLANESEFVFMSYGKLTIAKEERKIASKGYFFIALTKKYEFIKAMFYNCKDSFDPFG